MRDLGRPTALAVLATIVIVSLWTPIAHNAMTARWLSRPNLVLFANVCYMNG